MMHLEVMSLLRYQAFMHSRDVTLLEGLLGKARSPVGKYLLKLGKVLSGLSTNGQGQCPSDEDYEFLEEFVCHLYQPNTKETSMSRLRWNMLKQSQAKAERLPH